MEERVYPYYTGRSGSLPNSGTGPHSSVGYSPAPFSKPAPSEDPHDCAYEQVEEPLHVTGPVADNIKGSSTSTFTPEAMPDFHPDLTQCDPHDAPTSEA